MDMRLGPSTSVRIIAKSAFQGVRNKGFHCITISIHEDPTILQILIAVAIDPAAGRPFPML